jgi:hypothetical protein
MFANQPSMTLSAAKDLPAVLQTFVYEFALGTSDYRKHEFRYAYVLSELLTRLRHKREAEAMALDLDTLLGALRPTNMIESITYANIDLGAFERSDNGPRYIRAFSPQSKTIVFKIIWNAEVRGPATVAVAHIMEHGWVYMTCNYFKPSEAERARMRRPTSTTMRIHGNIQAFIVDLAAALEQ